MLNKALKVLVYATVVLLPLFFFPFFQDFFDYPKHKLFLLLFSLILILFLTEKIIKRSFVFRWHYLYIISSIFLVAFFASSVFSQWRIGSFLGSSQNLIDYFLLFLCFVLFIFLVPQIFSSQKEIIPLLFLFVFSFTTAVLVSLLYSLRILPIFWGDTFNILGRLTVTPLVSAILLPLLVALFAQEKRKLFKILLLFSFVVLLLGLILFNLQMAWILVFLSTVVFIILGARFCSDVKRSYVPIFLSMIILISSVFFFFFPIRILMHLPFEVSPNLETGVEILRGVYAENLKNVFLGAGPGTFVYAYSQYRSPIINQTLFWATRFSSGNSTFLDWFTTKGIFGGASLLILFLAPLFILLKKIRQFPEDTFYLLKLGILCVILGLFLLGFFYVYNFLLWFIFWFLLAILLILSPKKAILLEFNSSLKTSLFFLTTIVLIALVFVFFVFQIKQSILPEFYFVRAVESSDAGNFEKALSKMERAVRLNDFDSFYLRKLAQIYLTKSEIVSRDEQLGEEERATIVSGLVERGQETISRAIIREPFNVANWNIAGFFYRNLIGLQGAGELSLSFYRRAIELEPNSPFSYTEMARAYILMAQDFGRAGDEAGQKETLSLALERLKQAVELKEDYSPALYLQAVVYDQGGEIAKAIQKMEESKRVVPNDAGLIFRLGMLYWRNDNLEKAKKEFEEAISLMPNYSDPLYMLGLVYDRLENRKRAIELFEEVLAINPQNEEVAKILINLKNEKPALEGIIREMGEEEIREGEVEF